MSFSSTPLPLEFWTRLQQRIAVEYDARLARLAEVLKPTPATMDTGEQALQRGPKARNELFGRVQGIDNLQFLRLILGSQLREASFRAQIPEMEGHIAYLRSMAQLKESFLTGLPMREPIEEELQAALSQYAGLRTAGTGEIILSERHRLRALTFYLPLLGAEDTLREEQALHTLRTNIDQLESQLQSMKVSTMMALQVPDELAEVVASFGVVMSRDQEQEAPSKVEDDAPSSEGSA